MALFLLECGSITNFGHVSFDIFSINEMTAILKIFGQCDVKHLMTYPIKTITSDLKISTYIFTVITARPYRTCCDASETYVSTIISAVTLYVFHIIIYIAVKHRIFRVNKNDNFTVKLSGFFLSIPLYTNDQIML
jgi:hypothetical protein